jgi:hypothetical protein
MRPVKVGEESFPSITEAWRRGAVKSYCKLRDYSANNKDTSTVNNDNRIKAVTLNGVEYESVTKAAAATEITTNRIHAEITRTKSRVIVLPNKPAKEGRKQLPLTINGVVYPNLTQAVKATGFSQNTIQKKLRSNVTRVIHIEDDKRFKPLTVNGKEYPSAAKAALATGICFTTLSKLRREQGDSVTTALTDF